MKQKINNLLKQTNKTIGEDNDILVLVHKDGKCGVISHGNTENLAQALFACIHNEDSEVANALYRILKLNVMNILHNPSPYAVDLTYAIVNILNQKEKELKDE